MQLDTDTDMRTDTTRTRTKLGKQQPPGHVFSSTLSHTATMAKDTNNSLEMVDDLMDVCMEAERKSKARAQGRPGAPLHCSGAPPCCSAKQDQTLAGPWKLTMRFPFDLVSIHQPAESVDSTGQARQARQDKNTGPLEADHMGSCH